MPETSTDHDNDTSTSYVEHAAEPVSVSVTTGDGRHPLVAEMERLRKELDAARNKIANLEIALESSREIGAALGVVMSTRHVTVDEAFDLLRAVSQRTHRKLREVASDVVYTGALDETAQAE